MRTIIAGSRSCVDYKIVEAAVKECGWEPTVIISGTAYGADKLGEEWAAKNKITVEKYPANWDLYGKSAGYKRNQQMAEVADALIALWDGQSKGTGHMINIAKDKKLQIFIYKI